MASGEQLKALLKSHVDGDDDRFFSVAMQVAAHEARRGHGRLADELRTLIDRAKGKLGDRGANPDRAPARGVGEPAGNVVSERPIGTDGVGRGPRGPDSACDSGAAPCRAHPGAGSCAAAQVVVDGASRNRQDADCVGSGRRAGSSTPASAPRRVNHQVHGETAAKLRQIFEATGRTRGVYFFDEFDAIGSQRGLANDVGEIRRVLNSFLQMIEQDRSTASSLPRPTIQAFSILRFPSLRRHPALRVAREVANRAASQGTAVFGQREAGPVEQSRRPRGWAQLRGGRSRRRRGAEGCVDS